MIVWLAAALFLLVALRRGAAPPWVLEIERALGSRAAPLVAGLLSAAAVWYVLGSLSPTPLVHDEAAYVFQARIFAAFRWAMPARPMPEFFEQFHTLVTPVTAAKYPPAFALALVPGVWLGAPALMIVVLNGLTGALLFALARRFGNVWVAALATALWMAAPNSSAFRAAYYSEVLTGAVWLAGWMALLRWRDGGGRRWLVLLAVLVAFGTLARPLTMVAYALPTGAATVWLAVRRRAWADLALATAAAVLVLGLGPLWSARTTGSWRTTPLAVYTRQYLPYDKPGFTVDHTPPERAGEADMRAIYAGFLAEHQTHARAGAAAIYLPRARAIARSAFHGPWWPLLSALALVGVVGAAAEVVVAAGAGVLLVLLYGAYAHPATWPVYYVEATPVLAFLAAAGCRRIAGVVRRLSAPGDPMSDPAVLPTAGREAMLLAIVLASYGAITRAHRGHEMRAVTGAAQTAFFTAVRSLPRPSVVFVRYAAGHNPDYSLVVNEPDLAAAHAWIVYDRGLANDGRLMALAPGRAPYGYDEASHTLVPLGPDDLR